MMFVFFVYSRKVVNPQSKTQRIQIKNSDYEKQDF